MEQALILNYIQGCKRHEKRDPDFYDLMLFAGLSLELTQDLRELDTELPEISKYFGKSLYICGPQGAGKTVLAGHIFCETIRASGFNWEYELNRLTGKSTHPSDIYEKEYGTRYKGPEFKSERFCWYPGLIRKVKRSFAKDYEGLNEEEILDQAAEADFIVLDDLGAEYASEWSKNFMYMLVEERKSNLRPTVFTSNYSLEQMAENYNGHKISSRIAGMCKDRIIHLNEKDRRIIL
jgi:DNA replication protein DnaC